jgi:phage gp36-like protein
LSEYLGSFAVGASVPVPWATNSAAGSSITRAVDGGVRIYKNGGTTQRTSSAGITDVEDFDGVTGVHRISIDTSDDTDPGFYVAGATYQVMLTGATIDGQTVNAWLAHFRLITPAAAAAEDAPTGTAYCTRAHLEKFFASADIRKWADRNNTLSAVEIEAAVTDAIEEATAYIDDRLRGGRYVIPFTAPAPRLIQDLCRKWAGCLLYAPRGSSDTDENGMPIDRLQGIRGEVETRLRQLRAGQITLDVEGTEHVPAVVSLTLRRDEDLV